MTGNIEEEKIARVNIERNEKIDIEKKNLIYKESCTAISKLEKK